MILDRILDADLRLSCLSQMSMIVIFVPSMKSSLFGKTLTDASNGDSGTVLAHFPNFVKEMERLMKQNLKI